MKIITFQGGLGNQMFQYVFYLWLKSKHNNIFGYYPKKGFKGHNGLEIDIVFENIRLPKSNIFIVFIVYVIKLLKKLGYNSISTMECFSDKKILFEDYWQDITFDNGVNFVFKVDKLNTLNKRTLLTINKVNSVSIHVRRGDYLLNKYSKIYSGICDIEYYKKAIMYIKDNVEEPFFYIFSDDPEWVKKNFLIDNSLVVDWNVGELSFIDLFLISQCKHNIIANSTFSWWGAYMNNYEKKIVISPNRWFASDEYNNPSIFPNKWIRI